MKVNFLFFILLVALIITSCKDEETSLKDIKQGSNNSNLTDNEYVNDWVYMKMDTFYLWRDKLPPKARLNLNSDPYDFFEQLIYAKNTVNGDRFSWIENNYSGSTTKATSGKNDIGFEYVTVEISPTSFLYLILYVKPHTRAEEQGLKRGQVIIKVDDNLITEDNRTSLLFRNKSSYKLTYVDLDASEILEAKNLILDVTLSYEENPILLDSIYTVNSTQKVGYIIFNSFGDETVQKQNEYNRQLLNKLSAFANQGITDLVLDLRYNGGGLVSTAVYLASALVPNRKSDMLFEEKTYNNFLQPMFDRNPSRYKEWLYDYFVDRMEDGTPIPELGSQFKNLYVIAGNFTASASELTINGLRPYRTVTHIGKNTVGKNVGSFAIYEENVDRNKWKIQPIVFKSKNKNGDSKYGGVGFTPDIDSNDLEDFSQDKMLKPLGSTEETVLKAILAAISGKTATAVKSKNSSSKYGAVVGSSLERKFRQNQMFVDKNKLKNIEIELPKE